MSENETTTEMLAEIEGQVESTPVMEYTPPEGWRVLRFGEQLLPSDVWVSHDGTEQRSNILHWDASAVSGGHCIRRIGPEPEPQPEPEKVITPDDVAAGLVGQQLIRDLVLQVAAKIEEQPEPEPQAEGQSPEYTPPEGWRVLQVGEPLRGGDEYHSGLDRYIRRIDKQPEHSGFEGKILYEVSQPVQVREGRWRTRGGEIRNVTPTPEDDDRVTQYPWYDAEYDQTWASNGRCYLGEENQRDLVKYLGPIEQPDKIITQDDVAGEALAGVWDQVQAKRRIVELETLVADLRAVNAAQEKAVNSAARDKADLESRLRAVSVEYGVQLETRHSLQQQLEAVKAELVQQAETSRRLQIELDAVQQVPADSPELRQLRADLAEAGHDRDMYRHAHELLVQDIDATHQRTKAMTVEAIAEWLEPIRREDPHLRAVVLFHLPKIIRSLAGLNTPEDVD